MITSQVVERVLLVRTGSDSVWDRLYIVANLLVDIAGNTHNLGVLDTVLVTVVGVDLLYS